MYQTPTRSSTFVCAILPIQILNRRSSQSALVGRCAQNTDRIVGRCALISRPNSTVGGNLTNLDIFQGRACLSLNLPATGINYFTHFRHFCFVVSIKPRLRHHSTIVHIISDVKTTFTCIVHHCILWQYANFYADNSLFLGLSDNKLVSRSKE